MELQTLKFWRIVIPGAMILLLVVPVGQENFRFDAFLRSLGVIDNIVRGTGAVICGVFYYLLNLRGYVLRASLREIHENIKNKLLEPCKYDAQIRAAEPRLRGGRALLDVFYRFVDNDSSLRERAKNVRLNGLIWSSTADFIAISTFGALFYWGAAILVTPRPHYVWMAAGLAVAQFSAGLWAFPQVTRRHISLSDEQLVYIQNTYRKELCDRLRVLATSEHV